MRAQAPGPGWDARLGGPTGLPAAGSGRAASQDWAAAAPTWLPLLPYPASFTPLPDPPGSTPPGSEPTWPCVPGHSPQTRSLRAPARSLRPWPSPGVGGLGGLRARAQVMPEAGSLGGSDPLHLEPVSQTQKGHMETPCPRTPLNSQAPLDYGEGHLQLHPVSLHVVPCFSAHR